MRATYKIDDEVIKNPHDFKAGVYLITDANRSASGKMHADIIAKKRKFFFTYENMDMFELGQLKRLLYESKSFFHTLTYVEDNVLKTARVYPGDLEYSRFRTGDVWMYTDISVNLIEQ